MSGSIFNPAPTLGIGSRALGVLAMCALLVAGCGAEPAPETAAAPKPVAFRIQTFLPTNAPAGGGETVPSAANDPSAPPDTPLCGTASREAAQAAVALSQHTEAEGGACLATACYDALTDTYIGADGYRHVCQ